MKLREYLLNVSSEELTDRLKYVDRAIHELHDNGYFVVGDLADIEITDDKITLDSFKEKIDYLDSGYDINGDNRDIFELCLIGISSYNKLSVLDYMSEDYINFVTGNIEMLLEHGNIPSIVQEYYVDIFDRGNISYLNDFIEKNETKEGRGNSIGSYTKRTEVGKALKEKEDAAFISILVLPAFLSFLYISAVVIYFIFLR